MSLPTCNGCGDSIPRGSYSVDHIYPRSRGGTDDPENLWDMCRSCNSSKGQRTVAEWLKSASLKVVEYWRGRIPPVGKWDPDFNFRQRRRLTPIKFKEREPVVRLFVRLSNGQGAIVNSDQLDSQRVEISLLGSGKKKKIDPVDIVETVILKNMFSELRKNCVVPPKTALAFRRGNRVKIIEGPHAGQDAVVEFTREDRVYLSLRSIENFSLRLSIDVNSIEKHSSG